MGILVQHCIVHPPNLGINAHRDGREMAPFCKVLGVSERSVDRHATWFSISDPRSSPVKFEPVASPTPDLAFGYPQTTAPNSEIAVGTIGLDSPNDILRSRQQFKSWYSQYPCQFGVYVMYIRMVDWLCLAERKTISEYWA